MATSYTGAHGAALYFLITRDHPGHPHRLSVDEIYHFYGGASLNVALLTPNGLTIRNLGAFDEDGCEPQILIPAHTLHASATRGSFTLACATSFSDGEAVITEPTEYERDLMSARGFV
jgi:predicted cupin superfamily sugar epimerase